MPVSAPKPCSYPGCGVLVQGGSRCASHKHVERKQADERRGSAASRGYGSKWQRAREGFLRENPLCEHCIEVDRITASTVVDHKVPHKGDPKLFWNRRNWQALCKPHHDHKTATQDGGFGR
nr:HNH endonuclease [Nitrosospira sp. Nsp11]